MGRRVRETLNFEFERDLTKVLRRASPGWKTFRSPLVSKPPRR